MTHPIRFHQQQQQQNDRRTCFAQQNMPPLNGKKFVMTTHLHDTSSSLTSSASSWLLPTCSAENVGTVAITSGVTGLLSQLLLTKLLEKFASTTKDKASYTAHTIIAMALMILVSSIGVGGWWRLFRGKQQLLSATMPPATAAGRLMEPDATCRWLAAMVTGMFAVWDVPVSLAVRQLRKPDVIAHHIMMTIVAAIGAVYLPMHYIYFYLGVSELSSIPLLFYDQLQVMTVATASEAEDNWNHHSSLVALRDKAKVVAAISFTAVRAWLFTKVTLFQFIPDCLQVLPTISTGTTTAGKLLPFIMWASLGFTALQLYWFSTIVWVVVSGKEELPEADTA